MNIAETTLANAIRFAIRQYNEANIILAGPIGAGKHELSNLMKKWFETISSRQVNLLYQDDYCKEFKDIPENEYGKKLDLMASFETEEFVLDIRKLYTSGYVSIPTYNFNTWTRKLSGIIPESSDKIKMIRRAKINIISGSHALTLLDGVVPNAIKIYVNTNLNYCMQRRLNSKMFHPYPYQLSEELQKNYYESFILPQIKSDILPQIDAADIVIRN